MQLSSLSISLVPDSIKDRFKRKLKRWGFFLSLLPVLLPIISWLAAQHFGYPDAWAFLTVAVLYGAVPVLDMLIGKDPVNLEESAETAASQDRFFRYLLLASVPLSVLSLVIGLILFSQWRELSVVGQIGLVMSVGSIHANLMINAAHELIHKPSRIEQTAGGFLLSLVCYPGFKIEHLRGHHVHVATPHDLSTAALNQTLYHFIARALSHNYRRAWELEVELLNKRGKSVWSWNNELIRWYALVLAVCVAIASVSGIAGLVFFLGQSLIAIGILEAVNYLEHYGLMRQPLANGKYERTSHEHSWNSNFLLSNLMTFQLQRHADHHAHPQRRYQILRHFEASPQLPAAYSAMVLLALIPPLWKRVMNPRVASYYAKGPWPSEESSSSPA